MRVFALVIVFMAVVTIGTFGSAATRLPHALEIGLALLAIDAQPDHLRISEGLRVSNPGPPVVRDVKFALPAGASYVTFHLGLRNPRPTTDGFSDSVRFRTGITEIVYSYALPARQRAVVPRAFPFVVRRLEIVVRGPGVGLSVREGVPLPSMHVGDEEVRRWFVPDLPAGSSVLITLDGLPVTRAWIPAAAAAALALVLGVGVLIALRGRGPHAVHKDSFAM